MGNKIKSIVENFIALTLVVIIGFTVWIIAFAVPLDITYYNFKDPALKRGIEVRTVAKGNKAKWAAKFCTAFKDTAYLRDETGQIAEKDNPVNFNDGSIKKIPATVRVPNRFEDGRVNLWKRVVYRCFRFFELTVTSPTGVGELK
ncbi:hypothetical protein [uncultured Paraglaciecola sp.]|uniref:hypothetical protein n=1 Tax=uncultured Paraglaciecola sp. TaxID=1765024 RepID=UPI0026267D11|nr:hypothetical protein [uncultured Paraglaciecola sp.]